MTVVELPAATSPEAEISVVGQTIGKPKTLALVVGTMLEAEHFEGEPMRVIFEEMVGRYYADEPIDPLSIATACATTLTRVWNCTTDEAIKRVRQLPNGRVFDGKATDHALIVRRNATFRALDDLADSVKRAVMLREDGPEELAGSLSHEAMKIATQSVLSNEIVPFDELGARVIKNQRVLQAARARGVEIGAYFGQRFIDRFTRGLRPSELLILAGEPGAGKSAVSWKWGQLFAERQMLKPDKRIGTLIFSLEMAEEPSSDRIATGVTGIDGGKLREGRTDNFDLAKLRHEWAARKGMPLYLNHSSTLRFSQLKAITVEAIRRHNVGLIIIDHVRYLDMDNPSTGRGFRDRDEAEEMLSRALKQDLATELDVAVIVLAHTTKAIENRAERRPRLSDLRGSGQVSAHADYVTFVYRPYLSASEKERNESDGPKRTDAELIWAKSRHSLEGVGPFHFDPSTMDISDPKPHHSTELF